jgi:hypothetical protein
LIDFEAKSRNKCQNFSGAIHRGFVAKLPLTLHAWMRPWPPDLWIRPQPDDAEASFIIFQFEEIAFLQPITPQGIQNRITPYF